MSLDRFILERTPRWHELETMLSRARRGNLRAASVAELERFGILVRHVSSDLAIARRDFPDAAVTEYLNELGARAHPLLYRSSPLRLTSVPAAFFYGIPRAWRRTWPYMLASAAFIAVGFVAGWLAVYLRPDLRAAIVPNSLFDQMARGRVSGNIDYAPLLAFYIIQNNIRVALICFAGGVLLGLPTALALLGNGWMLGAIAAAVNIGGYNLQFWSLIVPHGMIELSIIVIAGGTGLMLGDSILRPGEQRRGDALTAAARRAVWLVCGTALLLVVAGTLEAFASPSGLPEAAKLGIGAGTGALLYSWLFLAGRKRRVSP
ncbi:MAG TPA: stage II sporulation protein M, partial [Candidatus Dormibacteraeota bacterium]|nr:stage II sporulation protein M [Candidatus Dormibacteraeota bacterium]